MMPPGHEPFLRAICQAPDDDAPRLVFADWLDEHGDPERAEFIRLQIRFAREPDAVDAEPRWKELFNGNWRTWVRDLPGTPALWAEFTVSTWPTPGATHFEVGDNESFQDTWIDCRPSLADWERGFPAAVYVQGSSDVFFNYLHPITEFVPVDRIRLLNLDDPAEVIRRLIQRPFLKKLRNLIVSRVALTDDVGIALANSPFAAELRFISIEAGRLTDRAGRAFAESPYLVGLEGLHLLHSEFNGSTRARLQARFGFNVHC